MIKPTCQDTHVLRKKDLKNDYYSLTLGPYPRTGLCRPGHFFHVQLPATDIFFRRAFSVAGVSTADNTVEIIFRPSGHGTRLMSRLRKGDCLNLLGPLGTPFAFPRKNECVVMAAGGVGMPPLLFFIEAMAARGFDMRQVHFFYGGRSAGDIVYRQRIKAAGVHGYWVTEDGTLGRKGLVTEPLNEFLQANARAKMRLYSCGPEPMLKAVNTLGLQYHVPGQLSMEAPMPCGIGVCLACVVPLTNGGHARVCVDGPVFDIGEVAL